MFTDSHLYISTMRTPKLYTSLLVVAWLEVQICGQPSGQAAGRQPHIEWEISSRGGAGCKACKGHQCAACR